MGQSCVLLVLDAVTDTELEVGSKVSREAVASISGVLHEANE